MGAEGVNLLCRGVRTNSSLKVNKICTYPELASIYYISTNILYIQKITHVHRLPSFSLVHRSPHLRTYLPVKHTKQQQLHLAYCGITYEAGHALGEVLSYARSALKTLNLMVGR